MDELRKKESWYDRGMPTWAGVLLISGLFAIIGGLITWFAGHHCWYVGAIVGFVFGLAGISVILFLNKGGVSF